MYHVPEAPPPPPPFGAHPGPQHLPAEMERLNLDHGIPPHSIHNGSHRPSVEGRYIGPSHQFDTSLPFDGDGKVPITYEGWSFTKQPAVRPDQKETWALVVKTPLSVSQNELRDQIMKQRKKGKSATDQLAGPDMNGFKRRQVERLIADRTGTDPDTRFEYKLGALKLDQKESKRFGKQTISMQVILKRQVRNGLTQLSSGYGRIQEVDGEIVDLTGAEDANYSQDSYSTGAPGHYAPPPPHDYAPPFMENPGVPYVQDPMFTAYPVPPHGSPPVQHVHDPFMPPHGHGAPPEAVYTPKADKKEKDKKDKHYKKDKKVEVHQKKEKKHKGYPDSSSDSFSDADSFNSKTFTDRTPDTVYSGGSGRSYHKDKKHSSSHGEGRRSSRSHDHSPVRKVYRERRRKSPTGSSRKGSTRYQYDDYDLVTSERHHDRDRAYRNDHGSGHVHERDRPSLPSRPLSFNDDRRHRPAFTQPRRLQSYAHPADRHAEKEESKWDIEERVRERMERERVEQDRLELKLETERLQMELDRERQERNRAERDRLDRLDRERSERERSERDMMDRERLDRERMERGRFEGGRMERERFDRDRFVDRMPYAEPLRRYPTTYDTRRDDRYYNY